MTMQQIGDLNVQELCGLVKRLPGRTIRLRVEQGSIALDVDGALMELSMPVVRVEATFQGAPAGMVNGSFHGARREIEQGEWLHHGV